MASGSSTSTSGVKDILESKFYFPFFRDLPKDYELHQEYYMEDPNTGFWIEACMWCFLGEITNDDTSQMDFLRNRVVVQDRSGKDNITVAFYPENGSFDCKLLKKGHTICVMFALQHYFIDGSIGLRIESLDTITAIPCSLSDLFALSAFYTRSRNACWACGKESITNSEAAISVHLKHCSKCRTAQYCCKQCQVEDWKKRHRRWCRALPHLLRLAKINYTTCKRNPRIPFGQNIM